MQILILYDDASLAQKPEEDLEEEDLKLHDTGEVTLVALKDGRFCTAAVDHKEHGLEIVAWNPV